MQEFQKAILKIKMAGLSKQHFSRIAEIIRINTYTQENDGYRYCSVETIIQEIADYFKTQNPLFNENRFKKACLE